MGNIKTEETERLERDIRSATRKMGVFGCLEVTIGSAGRVDYLTYDTKGIWRCYEIKVSKADFHSSAAKSFVGNYNYYVMPAALYAAVKEEIPAHIGVYTGECCIKKAKKQLLGADENLLDRMNTEIQNMQSRITDLQRKYNHLYFAVRDKYGTEEVRRLGEEQRT